MKLKILCVFILIKIKSKNELKEVEIKNFVCFYFDDIISSTKINFSNILLVKKLYKNISVYKTSHNTPTSSKSLRIRFDIIDGFNLILFDYRLFNKICDKIKHHTSKKVSISNSINPSFGKIGTHSYNSLSIKKMLNFHVIILIESGVNKNKNKYYCNMFLEKGSHKDTLNFIY